MSNVVDFKATKEFGGGDGGELVELPIYKLTYKNGQDEVKTVESYGWLFLVPGFIGTYTHFTPEGSPVFTYLVPVERVINISIALEEDVAA